MNAPKAGSRKATVYRTFFETGAEDAIAIGVSSGLKLGTIKSWINAWIKENGIEAPVKGAKVAIPVVKAKKPTHGKTVEVSYVKNPDERMAYLIEQGPQASIVRFVHNGSEQCIGNDQLGLPMVYRDKKDIYRG